MADIRTVAIIGCGSIGASWAALLLAQGLTVRAFDINPAAQPFLVRLVTDALPVLDRLGLLANRSATAADIVFTTSLAHALGPDVDFVQENGPETLAAKHELFAAVTALLRPDAILATSSSGLTCTSIQRGARIAHPERCVVGHPFNPPHLIPLVEVVGGALTSADVVARTMAFYARVGKKPVRVHKEVVGHIANRLQAALFREVLHLLQHDVASVADIDTAMSFGPGLRWGVMGPSTLFHLGGGEAGIQHMADHLLGPLMTWYAAQDPVVDDALKRKWVDGTLHAVDGRGYRELASQRDEELVRLLNVRQQWDGFAEEEKKKKEEEEKKNKSL
ncbi:3-hydroxyacyl-CoA dehydrogenase [Coniella lustricola]|uniref:3-hydroxyacyl-CoA dehydrogenase n=1 Tax=Coniella lustricola TaxID=2025994 RepID=A0A2T2ZXD8_9PEZI|nr:3-hydroxyacyl-CoA dehydrogenase [Coniella lustricola]